ncbi:MAG: beta-ketoacyl-ACP synthase III [Chitinophagaceae bacterium]|nr:beta-ketoacyl-ACP synthase III [Chitinophagaceae bacterium]MCB9046899.1 beta-ketoacyl-ACP synthase III [Chitinophagales bacterium]
MRPVYITRLSKFLPNEPVPNNEMEQVLGMVNGKPSKARAVVLRSNGIKTRYYAFRDGKSTHKNTELAAIAIKQLFDEKIPISKLELLTAGTGSAEQLVPSHASMVHGELGIHNVEIISTSGACCSSVQGLKYAFMSVGSGMVDYAVSVGSEKVSTWMHASRFQPEADNHIRLEEDPYIAFEKDFLRWMLSDGAAAALVQSTPNDDSVSLKIEWLEITSYANEFDACMYGGAVKADDGSLISWYDMPVEEWGNQSVFSLKQDTRLLGDNIVPKGGEFLKELMEKHNITGNDVDYFLPHMSSEFFKQKIKDSLANVGLDLPDDKWFYNLTRVGNVGSASTFLMLEELFNSGKLKKGEHILVMVPESARFSYAYIYLTVV